MSDGSPSYFPAGWFITNPRRVWAGWPFAATVMLFFLAHEMGHYICCMRYGIRATLPFFLPMPTPIGTMGAVILIRSPIRSRKALFDVGIAGPIAGFVVAFTALVLSFGWSKPLTSGLDPDGIGMPLIFELMHRIWSVVSPTATTRLPLNRVLLHPAAIGAWVGMYATALNLLPSGPLDGGHIVYAVAPRAHRVISWMTIAALLGLGRLNIQWWIWGGLLIAMNVFTFRQRQAPDYPALPASRWVLAVLALIILVLTFTISPFPQN